MAGRFGPLPLAATLVLTLLGASAGVASAQSLHGSRASLDRQNRQARAHDFTYLKSAGQLRRFVAAGLLVPVRASADVDLEGVSFPYARPEVRLFVQRLGAQFRAACGERLVVTSLTRPISRQPWNASSRSVHPTGMALDLRSAYGRASCRGWLERVLVSLEGKGILEATLEHNPPHYHVALFPRPYAAYVARITGGAVSVDGGSLVSYEVRRRDTLWRIARSHGTTPEDIQRANGLRSTTIYPGQVLKVPNH
jgi:hypothetical protein